MPEPSHIPERRAYFRQRIAVPAFIEDHHGESFPCRVIDLAPNSARIEATGLALPDTLILKLSWNVQRHCRVVWREGYVAGLQFRIWPVRRD
jgi:hypothetical protein